MTGLDRNVTLDEAGDEAVLAEPVYDAAGAMLLGAGVRLSARTRELLAARGIARVTVLGGDEAALRAQIEQRLHAALGPGIDCPHMRALVERILRSGALFHG